LILRLPGEKAGVGFGLREISSGDKKLGRRRDGTIDVAKKVLAFEIWHNLCFPQKVIVTGQFDGDKVMYWR
jgi:hypothetical protein